MSVKKRKTNNTQKKNNLKYKLKKNQRRRRTRNKKKINKMKGGGLRKWPSAKQVLESKPSMAQVVVDLKMEKGEAFTHCFQGSCPMLLDPEYLSNTNYLLENNCTTQPGPLCPKQILKKTGVDRYLSTFTSIKKYFKEGHDEKLKQELKDMSSEQTQQLNNFFNGNIQESGVDMSVIKNTIQDLGLADKEDIERTLNDPTLNIKKKLEEYMNSETNYITKTLENIKEKIDQNKEAENNTEAENNSRNNFIKTRKKILYKDYETKLAPFDQVIENVKKIDIFEPENKAIFLKIIDFIIICLEDLDNITGINMSLSSLDSEVDKFLNLQIGSGDRLVARNSNPEDERKIDKFWTYKIKLFFKKLLFCSMMIGSSVAIIATGGAAFPVAGPVFNAGACGVLALAIYERFRDFRCFNHYEIKKCSLCEDEITSHHEVIIDEFRRNSYRLRKIVKYYKKPLYIAYHSTCFNKSKLKEILELNGLGKKLKSKLKKKYKLEELEELEDNRYSLNGKKINILDDLDDDSVVELIDTKEPKFHRINLGLKKIQNKIINLQISHTDLP